MFKISEIIGNIVEGYVLSAIEAHRECRLILPGLTPRIAREIHQCIKYNLPPQVSSYLIIGQDEEPSKEEGKIEPLGLTSERIGSFVAVTMPGQLVHIPDSIRGSGGTIRSIAYSEEWPWIDDVGSESFRFDGPVLDALVKEWSNDPGDQEWLREFTLHVLIENTRFSSKRTAVFLEKIIGEFHPGLYPEIADAREKFLFHAGVPRPHGPILPPETLAPGSNRLCKAIIERYGEEGIREQAREKIEDLFPGEERREVMDALDYLLDSLGTSDTIDIGLLAFHGCWKNPEDWKRLDSRLLEDIFNVKPTEAGIKYIPRVERGLVSLNKNKVATFKGEIIEIEIFFENIPPEQVANKSWTATILSRQKNLVDPVVLGDSQGSIRIKLDTGHLPRYDKKIPLRIALARDGEIKVEQRLYLHICGEERPAFVVVEQGFDVIDAIPTTDDVNPGKKIFVKEPVTVYLLWFESSVPTVLDEDDEIVDLIELEMKGIWKPTRKLNVFERRGGQGTWKFTFNDLSAEVTFESGDVVKGEFTLEDELRVFLSNQGISESRVKKLLVYFTKTGNDCYPYLGGNGERSMHRLYLSRVVTSPTGWRPVLTNLVKLDPGVSGKLGNFVQYLGQIDDSDFKNLVMPEDSLQLLNEYTRAREAVLEEIFTYCNPETVPAEHPVYASHPIYLQERSLEMEKLVQGYLQAYSNIIEYIRERASDLSWHQLFVLVYLDCIVDWCNDRERNMFFMLGPWHPLVVAKRFMVQNALVSRAQRLVEGGPDGKDFRQLCALLGQIQGFRWVMALSTRDKKIEPAFVSRTTDPGWHIAFKINNSTISGRDETFSYSTISRALRDNLGLDTETTTGGGQELPILALTNYMKCYPSRRSIGIRVCRGYNGDEVVKRLDTFIHGEEGPTERGLELPGGIRLYMQDPPSHEMNSQWTNPPFFLYIYENDSECIRMNNPDIFMSQPPCDISFRNGDQEYKLPRGKGLQSVFYEPLRWLTDGPSHIPDSVTYEFDSSSHPASDLGSEFVHILGELMSFVSNPKEKISSVPLPDHLQAPWVVIPGQSLDPAILVKYVHDSARRSSSERALWDYKVELGGQNSSFFILSTIPRSFQVSVNGFFGREDIASKFIVELGKIGIAIGGEALKSGRRALGIIGIVGAVRLLTGSNLPKSPISIDEGHVGFLIPVDSFESFFGKNDPSSGKRSDILAVQIDLPKGTPGKMRISACGVECKFVSKTFSREQVKEALEQAKSTSRDFMRLVQVSLGKGAMPERLALLELIRFGLRVSSQWISPESSRQVDIERVIYGCILEGNYEYFSPRHEALLVSTEAGLQGMAEHVTLPDSGLWIRLTKTCWPGVANPSLFNAICDELALLFGPREIPATGEINPDTLGMLEGSERKQLQAKGQEIVSQGEEITGNVTVSRDSGHEHEEYRPLQKIFIGVDEARVAKYYDPQSPVDPLDNLNMMVTGSSGTGKTQFLKYLICKFREQDKNVLILDFKNDFASDQEFTSRARLERIFVNFDGLPYNPLIPYPISHPASGELYIQPGQYIAGVISVFRRTFRLGDQQSASLKKAMVSAFNEAGLDTTGTIPYASGDRFPDFSQVGNHLKQQNERAFNRLEPLFSLGLFKPEFKSNSFHELTGKSFVIDLSRIPSEDIKNALAQLIVMSAHSYFNSIPHSGTIRLLFIIDEAFRVLEYESMADFVLQCRAYGVGMLLSSQYPSQFPIDISSSLATKIIHGNGRDASRIRDIVQLIRCDGREGDIAGLERFQAFVDNRHHPQTLIRTMNYPLYLVWSHLQHLESATREELATVEGYNSTMLPINNLVQLLIRMGLAEEQDGKVKIINRVG